MRKSSVPIAKDRLKTLLITDRVNCKPNTYEQMSKELYQIVSKYIDVSKDDFDVHVSHSKIQIMLVGDED
ncbi:MAG: cell division topological specificity factor MinE [Lachnospiraceae bacterium]